MSIKFESRKKAKVNRSIKPHYVNWDREKIEAYWDVWGNLKPVSPWFGEKAAGWLTKEIYSLRRKHLKGERIKVLDLGCGAGFLLNKLSEMAFECYGVDISPERISRAKRDYPHINFSVSTINQTRFDDSFFDLVISTQTIEHILDEDLFLFFHEVNRILRKGGLILLTTRFEEDLTRGYRVCPDCHAIFLHSQHIQSFNFKRIRSLFRKAGIEPVILRRSRCRDHLRDIIPTNHLKKLSPILYPIFGHTFDRSRGKYLYAVGIKVH